MKAMTVSKRGMGAMSNSGALKDLGMVKDAHP